MRSSCNGLAVATLCILATNKTGDIEMSLIALVVIILVVILIVRVL